MYTITILRRAQKQIATLPLSIRTRVETAIATLVTNPRPPGCKKLINSQHWRIRVGDYRIVYDIDDPALTIMVVKVGKRDEVY